MYITSFNGYSEGGFHMYYSLILICYLNKNNECISTFQSLVVHSG